jgi:hypothetical protein
LLGLEFVKLKRVPYKYGIFNLGFLKAGGQPRPKNSFISLKAAEIDICVSDIKGKNHTAALLLV